MVLFDRGPMTDADHDAFRHFGAQHLVKREFQPLVERGGGLIEEYRLRLGEQHAGKSDPLLLARRQHLAQSRSSSSRPASGASATLVNASRTARSEISADEFG